MTTTEIRNAIYGRIYSNWTSTDVAWPNDGYTPDPDTPFIAPIIHMNPTLDGEVGEGGVGVRSGMLIFQVFVPAYSGDLVAIGYANTLETLFRMVSVDGVIFEQSHVDPVGVDVKFYQVNVSIPFRTFVGE